MEINKLLDVPNVFIIGAGRSGTTLLSNLLQNHPEIISLPEATFIFGLYPHFGNKNIKTCAEDFISSLWIRRDYNKSTWQIDEEKLRNLINKHAGPLSFSDACMYCFLSSERAVDKNKYRVVINKHPEYSWYIPLLMKLFPGCKFIILIRDYRDRYLSVKENFDFSFFSHIIDGVSWKLNYQIIEKEMILNSNQFHIVKYEDLIMKKDEQFYNILNFLNLNPNIDMSIFNKYRGEFKIADTEHGISVATNFNKVHKNSSRETIPDNFNKWQGKLRPIEVKILELFCGKYGLKFGYKITTNISLLEKMLIYFRLLPLLMINRLIFIVMKSSYRWPLPIQSKIYQLAKKRANLT